MFSKKGNDDRGPGEKQLERPFSKRVGKDRSGKPCLRSLAEIMRENREEHETKITWSQGKPTLVKDYVLCSISYCDGRFTKNEIGMDIIPMGDDIISHLGSDLTQEELEIFKQDLRREAQKNTELAKILLSYPKLRSIDAFPYDCRPPTG